MILDLPMHFESNKDDSMPDFRVESDAIPDNMFFVAPLVFADFGKDKTITVYIGGTWDLLHIGHVRVIQKAAQLGDRLIVGVTTDNYVHKYKGGCVIPYEQRMEVVSALKNVWLCVAYDDFEDYGPLLFYDVSIRVVAPMYGQHRGQIRALAWMAEHGIEVKRFPRTKGISSTIIRERMRNVGSK